MNRELRHSFSRRLYELRERAGYTQQVVAEYLHISRSAYTYYETGKTEPDLEKLLLLVDLYRISIADLLENLRR